MSQVDDAQIEKYSIQVRQKVSEERNQWKKDHWDSLTKEEKASFPAKVLNTFSLSVLDHGFVRFVGMGTKQTEEVIPQSARISYDGDELEHTEKEDTEEHRKEEGRHSLPLVSYSFLGRARPSAHHAASRKGVQFPACGLARGLAFLTCLSNQSIIS